VIYLDKYAIVSKLGTLNPMVKVLYFLLFVMVALFSEKIFFLSLMAIVLMGVSYWNARASFFTLFRIWVVPMGFVIIGCIPMCFRCSETSGQGLWDLDIAGTHIRLTAQNVKEALFVMVRSAAMISALLFLILSTSVSQIIFVMRKCRIPEIFIELAIFVYHSIFIIFLVAGNMHTSQKSRLGYTGWNNRRRTFSVLIGRVLILSLKKAGDQWNCIVSRNYEQGFYFLPLPYRSSKHIWMVWICSALLLVLLLYITNHMSLA
jgi:cobalt/nickel transport system permease protein